MEDFLKKITHPNKRELANSLLNGTPPEDLYEEYGKIRVLEMQKAIQVFQTSKPTGVLKKRAIDDAGCRACRRYPGTCN